jgi:hypothetical protein
VIRTANEVRRLASSRRMVHSPSNFDGPLEKLVEEFVLPNLPSPERVTACHRLLIDYCNSDDPLFLIRRIKATTRGEVYFTDTNVRFKATDNAPAWWMHFVLFHEIDFSAETFPTVVATIPTHMFEISAHLPHSISSAGWHVAHIGDVNDRNTDFASWDRDELAARFLRNVHPCNCFFLPKRDWQKWGADKTVIGFFSLLYAQRYSAVWSEFVAMSRVDLSKLTRSSDSVRYHYGSSSVVDGLPRVKLEKAPLPSDRHVVPHDDHTVISYSASRLLFKADVIERLADSERFRVVTPEGSYEMSKADFIRAFPKVRETKSYRESRIYHYPKVPAAAAEFLVDE